MSAFDPKRTSSRVFAVVHNTAFFDNAKKFIVSGKKMRPFAPISRRDLIALVFCAAVAVMVLLFAARFPNSANWGFGPDWNCENVPQGEAVCVKRPSGGNSGDAAHSGH
jgi:hypothetical protein